MKSITAEINVLRAMKVPDLATKYRDLFGKQPRIKHKEVISSNSGPPVTGYPGVAERS